MKRLPLKQKLLQENDRIARGLRDLFLSRGILALNFISAPGSGKTSLLEQTLQRMPVGIECAVLTGDIATENDALRLQRFGSARQITTGGACHLDAKMIENALEGIETDHIDVLLIENVGNLVCPASFDLGENAKVVLLSVTEGDDKPLKYPNIFVRSDVMVVNKIDLLPYVEFDLERVSKNATRTHPGITMIKTSCTTGEGIDDWIGWLQNRLAAIRQDNPPGL